MRTALSQERKSRKNMAKGLTEERKTQNGLAKGQIAERNPRSITKFCAGDRNKLPGAIRAATDEYRS
jgi:hypothetical protein